MKKPDLIFVTRNRTKAAIAKVVFNGYAIMPKTLGEAGIIGDPMEDGFSIEETAELKGRFAWDGSRTIDRRGWTMGDDSGLFVPALNQRLGHRTPQWVGTDANIDLVGESFLRDMDRLGVTDRTASLRTAVVVISPGGTASVFRGKLDGVLLEAAIAPPQPQMPFSGIFKPDGEKRVLSQIPIEELATMSHHGQALTAARNFIIEWWNR